MPDPGPARPPLPDLAGPADASYDVAVIGGGVNGTGVLRDLALRGMSVVLFERHDFAFGASGNSSGMIHGGPRYLLGNPSVTKSSCLDSGYIQRIAPHLLFRIPFLVPMKGGARGRVLLELYDAFFRAYDDFQPLKRGEPHTRLDASELSRLEPGLVGSVLGGVTFDEWGVDGARLCVLNAVDAVEHGAQVHTHTRVDAFGRVAAEGSRSGLYALSARNDLTGARTRVHARVVVNATGAWGPLTAALGGLPSARVKIRPAKGIHVVLDRRLSNYALLTEAIDGRQIFLEPWQNMSVVGTTDDDYYGDLDDVVATSEEVRYLVQGIARVFPSVRTARAIGTWGAVRPTLYRYGPNEDRLSREHAVVDHARDGAERVYSMIGGKLASYRLFAQEMADVIARVLDVPVPCSTHTRPLPGGDRLPDAARVARDVETTPVAGRRLVYRHGSRAERIAARVAEDPREGRVVCDCEPVLVAEVRHAVDEEMAQTTEDVARRTRLGLGPCGGMRCVAGCAKILAENLGRTYADTMADGYRFLVRQSKRRAAALGPAQARQEALALQHWRSIYGVREGR